MNKTTPGATNVARLVASEAQARRIADLLAETLDPARGGVLRLRASRRRGGRSMFISEQLLGTTFAREHRCLRAVLGSRTS